MGLRKKKKKKDWTLILIADSGPAGSFQIKRRLFRMAVLVILGAAAIGGTWLYLREMDHRLVKQQLSEDLMRADESLKRFTSMNRELSSKIGELEHALTVALDEKQAIEKGFSETAVDLSGKGLSVENFEMARDPGDTTIRFKFLLRNVDTSGGLAAGYIFVVYRPDYLDSSTWRSYPPVSMKGGMPEDFRQGDSFNIARFKTIRGYFTDVPPSRPSCISVWIFSNDGELLYFKDYFFRE